MIKQYLIFQIHTNDLTGSEASATVTTIQDGSILYDPIPGDMLQKYHSDQQVSLIYIHVYAVAYDLFW